VRSRIAPARARARRAKLALAAAGLGVFGAAIPLARLHYAGHPKRRPRALDAPQSFRQSVSNDLLRAGILAPAEAPPGAATAVS
jgi:hypothetical protein